MPISRKMNVRKSCVDALIHGGMNNMSPANAARVLQDESTKQTMEDLMECSIKLLTQRNLAQAAVQRNIERVRTVTTQTPKDTAGRRIALNALKSSLSKYSVAQSLYNTVEQVRSNIDLAQNLKEFTQTMEDSTAVLSGLKLDKVNLDALTKRLSRLVAPIGNEAGFSRMLEDISLAGTDASFTSDGDIASDDYLMRIVNGELSWADGVSSRMEEEAEQPAVKTKEPVAETTTAHVAEDSTNDIDSFIRSVTDMLKG